MINVGYNLLLWGVDTSQQSTRTENEKAALTKIKAAYRIAFFVYVTGTIVA